MSKTRRLLQLALALTLATSVQSQAAPRGAGGDSPPPASIATVKLTPSRLDCAPVPGVGTDTISLAIAGPQGFHFEKRFPPGTPMTFELGEVSDRTLPDGPYSYELRTAGAGAEQVQSGFFSVREGSFVVRTQSEVAAVNPHASNEKAGSGSLTPKNFQIYDDLVVQGNACIGTSCDPQVNIGDGLQLRYFSPITLWFHDLPGTNLDHDWQIITNDGSGGEFFTVKDAYSFTKPFKLMGSAPDNSLFVSSSGNVGFGTATPAVKLDAKVNSSGNAVARVQNQSGTGYSSIEYLNQSGTVVASLGVDNAAAYTVLNTIQNYPLAFLTQSAERLRITSAGNVGIGTSSPVDKFHIVDGTAGAVVARIQNTTASGYSGIEYAEEGGTASLFFGTDNANNISRLNSLNNFPIVIYTNGTERIRFPSPGGNYITAANGASLTNGGVWTNASSRELKRDISELDSQEALAAFSKLNPIKFGYKADPDERHIGFIAEDVPDLVASKDHKGLSALDVVALLTKVVQEQQKTIDTLSARLDAMQQDAKK